MVPVAVFSIWPTVELPRIVNASELELPKVPLLLILPLTVVAVSASPG